MITIQPMLAGQAQEILEIYRHGIESGMATFETEVPEWPGFEKKYLAHSRIVAIVDNKLAGWAALSPVSSRECYSGVAEVSVYVHGNFQRQGIGRELLIALISESEKKWCLVVTVCYSCRRPRQYSLT